MLLIMFYRTNKLKISKLSILFTLIELQWGYFYQFVIAQNALLLCICADIHAHP